MFKKWFGGKEKPPELPPAPVAEPPRPRTMLDVPIIGWGAQNGQTDVFTIRDACEGVQIFGGMGSGKSSGSGYTLAKAFLDLGMGGLVLCAKPDEAREWRDYAREANREADLIVLDDTAEHAFNFLDYEMNRKGPRTGSTRDLIQLFGTALEMLGGSEGNQGDRFWRDSVMLWLRHAINLLAPSDEAFGMETIAKVIKSAPRSGEEYRSKEWRESSFLWKTARSGFRNIKAGKYPERERDFERASDYWLGEAITLPEKTRSSIMAVFNSMSDGLLDGLVFDLFSTRTTFTPEVCEAGKIVILDVPVLTFNETGAMVQGLVKYIFQKAIGRRDTNASPLPIFHWADESQLFVNSYDAEFQQTARSSRCCTVFLTQNISNYYARIGGRDPKAETDRLLGGLQTKIFHLNGDKITNEYAADTIAKEEITKISQTLGTGDNGVTKSVTASTAIEYSVPPNTFLSLKNGSDRNGGLVTGLIFKPGMVWQETGRPFRMVGFKQRGF